MAPGATIFGEKIPQNTRIPSKTWVEAKDKACCPAQPTRAELEQLWVPPARQPQPPPSPPYLVKLGPQGTPHHGQGPGGAECLDPWAGGGGGAPLFSGDATV